MSRTRPFRFTGYHATVLLIAFFGVIILVNFTMARFALSTFGGTVVDNSYVASQKYNDWLQQAREQAALGWKLSDVTRAEDRLELGLSDQTGAPLSNAEISVLAEHPVGRAESLTLAFVHLGAGQYRSAQSVPAGRYKLRIEVSRAGQTMRTIQEIE